MRPFIEQHQLQIQAMLTALDHSLIKYSHYYFHYGSDLAKYDFDTMAAETTGNIVIFHHDHFDDENNQLMYNKIKANLQKLANKRIIVVTSLLNLTFDLDHVKTIHCGGDLMLGEQQFKQLSPQRTKNFNNPTHWVSLTRVARSHRILTLIYMLGKELTSYGHIRCSAMYLHTLRECSRWTDVLTLINYADNSDFCTKNNMIMCQGYSMLKNQYHIDTQDDPVNKFYKNTTLPFKNNTNSSRNFDCYLKKYYENSVGEIVNETLFFQPQSLLTEKFLNSVYGFNLPIILSGAGTVEHLRNIGFDLFDDVIDHAYDLVPDPLLRIQTAIDSNQRLFMDPEFARQCWKDNVARLEQNFTFAQTKMYDVYRARCLSEFNAVFPQHFNPIPNQ